MADNVTTQSSTLATIPASTKIATDEDASNGHVQIVKLAISTDGSATPLTADNTDGLLVNLGSNNDVTVSPTTGTFTDGSGSIASANTSEQIFASNSSRQYLLVQNVSDTDMWVNFGTSAVKDQPSIRLLAHGGSLVFEGGFVPTSSVNIICGTVSKSYTAKQA